MDSTEGDDYTKRLTAQSGSWWKRLLNVQAPYRWKMRRQRLGRTLDIGCGIGRNLAFLPEGSVGVDHNPSSIAVARKAGLRALTTDEWATSDLRIPETFDSLLLAHVVEHMPYPDAVSLLREYLPHLRRGGKVLLICPQERGYASDPTHQTWMSGEEMTRLASEVGLDPAGWSSFPLPRFAGKAFMYNEFHLTAYKH